MDQVGFLESVSSAVIGKSMTVRLGAIGTSAQRDLTSTKRELCMLGLFGNWTKRANEVATSVDSVVTRRVLKVLLRVPFVRLK
jgi:hypothetical protein